MLLLIIVTLWECSLLVTIFSVTLSSSDCMYYINFAFSWKIVHEF